jgi:hypothetical protein
MGIVKGLMKKIRNGDYPRDGVDRCSFCGMPWCISLYLSWFSMKISALSRLKTELMIYLA